jgi:Fe-S-cluster containining protein
MNKEVEDFDFYISIRLGEEHHPHFSKLHNIYKKIPGTTGCLENLDKKDGSCGGWCCNIQCPQMLYVEFLNIWQKILKDFTIEEIWEIIEKSIKNYVAGFVNKGCVFFDNKECTCKAYLKRPYSCRVYGITPSEVFSPRYKKTKDAYKDVIGFAVKDQCDLVKIENDFQMTPEILDEWWSAIADIEHSIGIGKKNINDDVGGSYRTPHDHILLYMMPVDILEKLQILRTTADDSEKILALDSFMKVIREKIIK